MSLITCPDCGHQVSSRAATCPKCGGPVRSEENAPSKVVVKDVDVSFEKTTATAGKYLGSVVLIILCIGAGFAILRLIYAMLTGE
ncbi:MAG: zinc-ribbon domain-containing protein [Opitutus sp.]|nr:zinc-ribbon domain-containing protein [Opitutus sp.]